MDTTGAETRKDMLTFSPKNRPYEIFLTKKEKLGQVKILSWAIKLNILCFASEFAQKIFINSTGSSTNS